MIEAVRLKLSPEMLKAIDDKRGQDNALEDAWIENVILANRKQEWEIKADQVADWCGDWFSESDLEVWIDFGDRLEMTDPGFCEDPLLKDFVDTILKIYRLTHTG